MKNETDNEREKKMRSFVLCARIYVIKSRCFSLSTSFFSFFPRRTTIPDRYPYFMLLVSPHDVLSRSRCTRGHNKFISSLAPAAMESQTNCPCYYNVLGRTHIRCVCVWASVCVYLCVWAQCVFMRLCVYRYVCVCVCKLSKPRCTSRGNIILQVVNIINHLSNSRSQRWRFKRTGREPVTYLYTSVRWRDLDDFCFYIKVVLCIFGLDTTFFSRPIYVPIAFITPWWSRVIYWNFITYYLL